MDKNVIGGGSIVTGGRNESKSLAVGKPLDVSLDLFGHGCFSVIVERV